MNTCRYLEMLMEFYRDLGIFENMRKYLQVFMSIYGDLYICAAD